MARRYPFPNAKGRPTERLGEQVVYHKCPRCQLAQVPNFLLVCKHCWDEMPRTERLMAYTSHGKMELLRLWAEEGRMKDG